MVRMSSCRGLFLGVLALSGCTAPSCGPQPPDPVSLVPLELQLGRFDVEFHWACPKPDYNPELFVFGRVEDWGTEGHASLGVAGPVAYTQDPVLDFDNIATGDRRRVVIEFREGTTASARKRYYGISQDFELRSWKHTHVDVTLDMVPTPAGGPSRLRVVADPGAVGSRVRSSLVALELFTDVGVQVVLSNTASFAAEATRTLPLQTRCNAGPTPGLQCYRLEGFDLQAGRNAGPCTQPAGCDRPVYARFVDPYGYESDPVQAEVTWDPMAPVLAGGSGLLETVVTAEDHVVVNVVAEEPLQEPPVLEPAELGFELLRGQGGEDGGAEGLIFRYRASAPASALGPDGPHLIRVRLRDLAGNPFAPDGGTAITVGEVTLDSQAPTLVESSLTPPRANTGTPVEVEFRVSEPMASDWEPRVTLGGVLLPERAAALDGGLFHLTHAVSAADAEGVLGAVVQLRDRAGNIAYADVQGSTTVDRTAPVLVGTSNSPVGRGGTVLYTVTANEPLDGNPVLILTPPVPGVLEAPVSSSASSYTFAAPVAAFAAGTYQVQISARDLAGNEDTLAATSLEVDLAAPAVLGAGTVCVENPGQPATCLAPLFARHGSTITAEFTVDQDLAGEPAVGLDLEFPLHSEPLETPGVRQFRYVLDVECPQQPCEVEGLRDVVAVLRDPAGNTVNLSLGRVEVDATPPGINTASLSAARVGLGQTAVLSMTASEPLRGAPELSGGLFGPSQADGGTWFQWSHTVESADQLLGDGGHLRWTARLEDLAGNVNPAAVLPVALDVDTRPPDAGAVLAVDNGAAQDGKLYARAGSTLRATFHPDEPLSRVPNLRAAEDQPLRCQAEDGGYSCLLNVTCGSGGFQGESTHAVWGDVVDQAGNRADVLAGNVFVDCVPPALSSSSVLVTPNGCDLERGLVKLYTLDDPTADTAVDSTATHDNLLLAGTSWSKGRWGAGLWMRPGSWAAAMAPHNLPVGDAPRTLAAWVFVRAFPAAQAADILAYGDVGRDTVLALEPSAAGTRVLTAVTGSSRLSATLAPALLPAETWLHLAFTYEGQAAGGGRHLYVEGREVAADQVVQPLDTLPGVLRLGRMFGSTLDAVVDDLRVYDRALDAPAVAVLATLGPRGRGGRDRATQLAACAEVVVSLVTSEPMAQVDGGSSLQVHGEQDGGAVSMAVVSSQGTGHLASWHADRRAAEGALHITAELQDVAGNRATVPVGAADLQVDTQAPPPVDTSAVPVTLHRAPWGASREGETARLYLAGPAAPVGAGEVLLVLDGPNPAAAAELGRREFTADGGAWTLELSGTDRSRVWLAAVDRAGNVSVPVDVREVEWLAGLGGKVPGSVLENPHSLAAVSLLQDAAEQDPLVSVEPTLEGYRDVARRGSGTGVNAVSTGGWTKRELPGTSPSARMGASMAWDSRRGRLLMMGGIGLSEPIQDLWSWEHDTWKRLTVVGGPATSYGAAVYDPARDRLVYFGGGSISGSRAERAEVMELDGQNWTAWSAEPLPQGWPAGRSRHGMAQDTTRNRTVMFGGMTNYNPTDGVHGDVLGDTWEWDGVSWREPCKDQACPAAPSARAGCAVAYDPLRQRLVLFGGFDDGHQGLGDTWEWDGVRWHKVAADGAGPPARAHGVMVYDPQRQEVVLAGGGTLRRDAGDFLQPDVLFGDAWSWDGAHWKQVSASAGGPVPRLAAAGARDPRTGKVVMFGGLLAPNSPADDTLEWGGTAWGRREPTVPVNPGVREYAGHAYALERGRMVLFGGRRNGVELQDTWEWNGSGWTQRTPASHPSARQAPTMVAFGKPGQERVLLFGGRAGNSVLGDMWSWDGSTWTQLCGSPLPACAPAARALAPAAFDSERNVVVMAGGATNADPWGVTWSPTGLEETWEWDGAAWKPRCSGAACGTGWQFGGAMAFDEHRRVTVFQAADQQRVQWDSDKRADTWEWDGNQWTLVCAHESVACRPQCAPSNGSCADMDRIPNPVAAASLVYDPARRLVVLFGGQVMRVGWPYSDTLAEWDGTSWRGRFPEGARPQPRVAAAMEFDRARGVAVLYSGIGAADDTWELDLNPEARPAMLYSVSLGAASPGTATFRGLDVRARGAGRGHVADGTPRGGLGLALFDNQFAGHWRLEAVSAGDENLNWQDVGFALLGDAAVRGAVRGQGPQQVFTVAVLPLFPAGKPVDGAQVQLDWVEAVVSYCAGGCQQGVRATYFRSPAPGQFGDVLLQRHEPAPGGAWADAPAPGVPADAFAARWEGAVNVEVRGDYTFTLDHDDGVRLDLDGVTRVDNWSGGPALDTTVVALEAGWHAFRLDVFDDTGPAKAGLTWQGPDTQWRAQPLPPDALRAPDLDGARAVAGLARRTSTGAGFTRPTVALGGVTVDASWSKGVPLPSLPDGVYATTWEGEVDAGAGGSFTFRAATDLGVRLSLDGMPVLGTWPDTGSPTLDGSVELAAGWHRVVVEALGNLPGAVLELSWQPPGVGKAIPLELANLRCTLGP